MVTDSARRNAGAHGQHGAAVVCSVVPQELNVKPDLDLCQVSTTYCTTRSSTQQLGHVQLGRVRYITTRSGTKK